MTARAEAAVEVRKARVTVSSLNQPHAAGGGALLPFLGRRRFPRGAVPPCKLLIRLALNEARTVGNLIDFHHYRRDS